MNNWKERNRDAYKLKVIFGVYDNFVVENIFSWTSSSGRASRSMYLRHLRNNFWQIVNLWVRHVCLCTGVYSTDAVTSRRYSTLLRYLTLANTCDLTGCLEKKLSLFSRGVSRALRKSFSLGPGSTPPFRHASKSLLVRGLLGDCYFCIYFISCLFYWFLLNSNTCNFDYVCKQNGSYQIVWFVLDTCNHIKIYV